MAMFSSSSKYEEAAELLEKACNNYKLAKMWREAADGFALLADCHDKSDSKHDAATAHVDAANALKKIDVDAAVASLRVAVSMFQDMGRLSISAKHLKDIGETFEKADKLEGALDAYTQAADIYAAEESSSTANSCKLKVAEIKNAIIATIATAHGLQCSDVVLLPPAAGRSCFKASIRFLKLLELFTPPPAAADTQAAQYQNQRNA